MANDGMFPGVSLRQRPANLLAEQSLLGALLFNNQARQRCLELLPEHFSDPELGRVYARIIERVDAGKTVSGVSLKGEFPDGVIAELLASMVAIVTVPEYALVIRECAARNALINLGENLVTDAFEMSSDLSAEAITLDGVERILEIARGFATGRGQSFAQAIDAVLADADAAYKGTGKKGLMTGIATLDDIWGGLWPGLDVLGARSSHGKTILGMQIAEGVAERLDEGVVQFFSLEMPNADLALRMLQSRTGVSADSIRSGKIGSVAQQLLRARSDMLALRLDVIDTPALSITDISIRAKADKKRLGTKLIVIDHLHRIAAPAHMSKTIRLEQVRYISPALKDLAGELDLPILCLAQLSSDVERRPDHRPRISDIEYLPERDADNILLLWRPALYLGAPPLEEDFKSVEQCEKAKQEYWKRTNYWKSRAEAILAKRRFGAPSNVLLGFEEATLRFTDGNML